MHRKPLWLARARNLAKPFRDEKAKSPKADVKRGVWAEIDDSGLRGALYLYEQIGYSFWSDTGVSAGMVVDALEDLQAKGVKALDLYINSEGGDVFEAKAMYANLKRFADDDGEIAVHVDGLCASAATMVAMAGDTVTSSPLATWMIHQAWTFAMGNADDLRKTAEVLDLEDNVLAELYAKKTGETPAKCLELMKAETWMSADDALELGLTDEIDDDADSEGADTASSPAMKSGNLIAAQLERTQQIIRGASPAQLLAARASVRRMTTKSDRASPAEAHRQR